LINGFLKYKLDIKSKTSKMIYGNIPEKYLVENSEFYCNVCYEEKIYTFPNGDKMFDGFYHPATKDVKHQVCCGCMEQMVCVCKNDDCHCCGFNWRCPFCRNECGFTAPSQLIACMGKSWNAVDKIERRN